ncbi:MAG: sigma-70 family RNA polymerase sigma factor [Oscillatoriales cyanobacterium]|uniref:DNA-binding response regulator n=1 Tax=Microcoleus sp. PH2017_05_CCC_O_A TaxID=2798816 RepID=UPI001E125E73|nr:DNA-binding response regulator [Microcoleus sp. PH2017_05_CCC_O_A]TAG07194.1 MAG: sigma-70 family RNA polymerase sigma factor [Oscillatoriales cyanobacterium]MCC3434792.1 sigma-70 family RNA polymerase sigma factor [Microcoleus sp. PH2017_05_CCC_O_A]TAG16967.1 MAG: sigma-70 family RNA polymerase sigma factor [Oscillatoriales cyanobacterium]TAG34343.1 MAG: sigma-70 family RNA polymerase sigma factor [Oscillatoriales cyanobacterium]TAG56633.1 MAG: sigma-70 family RNA polymerase sigma factor [
MEPEQEQEILTLRDRQLTPKQIARKLGLKASEVSTFLISQAEQTALASAEKGELLPVAQCLVDVNFAKVLLGNETSEMSGLGLVMVTRSKGYNRFVVTSYLIDYWCLGVKDAMPPRNCNDSQYKNLVENAYSQFLGYEEISLEQAQALVWGAIAYAKKLGFEPHRDFEQSKAHLGESTSEIGLNFGRNGEPCYVEGPYDNTTKIINTLKKSVGDGNFDFLHEIG